MWMVYWNILKSFIVHLVSGGWPFDLWGFRPWSDNWHDLQNNKCTAKNTIIERFHNRSCVHMRVDLTSEFSLFGCSESNFLNLNAHQWTTHRFYVITCNSQIYFAVMQKWIKWTQVIFFHKICSHTVQAKLLANLPEMKPKAWQKLCDSDLTDIFYSVYGSAWIWQ